MLLKQLEYFIAVVDHNSFTQAAYEQYISQSAISQQIKALESSLGVELMVREKRRFHLTPAGQYLYHSGKQMMQRVQELEAETTRIGQASRKLLRVGYLNRYSGIAMQQAVIATTKRYRDLDVRMQSGSHAELMDMLKNQEVDIVFNDYWQTSDVYGESHPVATATTVVEVPQGYTQEGQIDLKDIVDMPLILVCNDMYKCSEEEHYKRQMGFTGSYVYANTLEEARYLVAANQGILLVDRFKYLVDPLPGIERKRIVNHGKSIEQDYYFYIQNAPANTYADAFKDIFIQILEEF